MAERIHVDIASIKLDATNICLLREEAQEGIARADDERTALLVSQFEVLGDAEGVIDRGSQIDGADRV